MKKVLFSLILMVAGVSVVHADEDDWNGAWTDWESNEWHQGSSQTGDPDGSISDYLKDLKLSGSHDFNFSSGAMYGMGSGWNLQELYEKYHHYTGGDTGGDYSQHWETPTIPSNTNVPEPATYVMLATMLVVVALARRRRQAGRAT